MIKITDFNAGYCKVLFEVKPVRPAHILEPKLGVAIAGRSPDYCVTKEGKIYRVVEDVNMDDSILALHKKRAEAQEDFSKKIHKLNGQLDHFKLLRELTKKEKKNDEKN